MTSQKADSQKQKTSSHICSNKNASRNYSLLERVEAGLVLQGTEVKSIRAGGVHIHEAYGIVRNEEVFLENMHIGPYSHGNRFNHEPRRSRKLLLNKSEIRKLIGAVVEKGFALVPVNLYWSKGRVKVELALAKGKNKGDKREGIKSREAKREMDQAMKKNRTR
jgi:SsrA-binding protein